MQHDEEPNSQLDAHIAWAIEFFNDLLLDAGIPLQERPLHVLRKLLQEGIIQPHTGREPIPMDRIEDHLTAGWFQALYIRVERWFERTYGAEAMRGKGVAPLKGVVLFRGVPYALAAPGIRSTVHIEGEQAWMHFHDRVHESEDALTWLRDPPDFDHLSAERRAELQVGADEVATALRTIYFHRMGVNGDPDAEGLADAARQYIESAAQRILTAKPQELGPAWFDLQMAAESACKLLIQMRKGSFPHSHDIEVLFADCGLPVPAFDIKRFAGWPPFKLMSGFRYALGDPGGLSLAYEAYRTVLDLVAACMATIETVFDPGAGLLVKRPPWLPDIVKKPKASQA